MLTEYLQRRLDLKNGLREKDPRKEKKPIARQSEKAKAANNGRPRMSQRSEKMKGIISALRPLYDKFLADRPICEIRSEDCTGQATCVHHTEGRGVNQILDNSKWKACCSACNLWCETHHAEAEDKGMKVSRHKIKPLQRHRSNTPKISPLPNKK